ncbi:MAG: hypothetical protein BWY93_02101 [Euryarchaeota archaeon ADurb.BinA087]|nr:MAG: hypothetical protein BWY93_02101 [Euryarchaeota archaeon ADurb.BinA087]
MGGIPGSRNGNNDGGFSPERTIEVYIPPEGMELIEKYPCSLPGAGVAGSVEIIADDAVTAAASSNTITTRVEDFIDIPPTGIPENTVVNYFNLPIRRKFESNRTEIGEENVSSPLILST